MNETNDSIESNYAFIADGMNGELYRPLAYQQDTVTWQEETYEQILNDIRKLLDPHWREAGRDHKAVPMNPNWQKYSNLAKNGELLIVTGRDNGRLIAYHVFFITKHINYMNTLWSTGDIYYVCPEYRNRGYFGHMVDLGERYGRARGVVRFLNRCKPNNKTDSVFLKRGYALEEVTYEKTYTEV